MKTPLFKVSSAQRNVPPTWYFNALKSPQLIKIKSLTINRSSKPVTLELRPLTPEQLTAAVQLDQACLGGLWTLEGYRRELESPNSDLMTWFDHQNQSVIGLGCLWAILEEAHITVLAVHPDYQGRGLGQALLYALLKSAKQRQLERATLEVRASNQVALTLYEKFGFRLAGRRKRYYQNPQEDALILWRNDLHHPEFDTILANWLQQIRDRLSQAHPDPPIFSPSLIESEA